MKMKKLVKAVAKSNPKASIEELMRVWNWIEEAEKQGHKVEMDNLSVFTTIENPDLYEDGLLIRIWFSDFLMSEYAEKEGIDEEYQFEEWRDSEF